MDTFDELLTKCELNTSLPETPFLSISITQRNSESVGEFSERILAFSTAVAGPENLREKLCCDIFLEGLQPLLRRQLNDQAKSLESLSLLVSTAQNIESDILQKMIFEDVPRYSSRLVQMALKDWSLVAHLREVAPPSMPDTRPVLNRSNSGASTQTNHQSSFQ